MVFIEALLAAGADVWRLPESAQASEAQTRRVVIYLVEFPPHGAEEEEEGTWSR